MGAPATPPNVVPFYSMKGGATPFTRGEAQSFARSILNSQTYRDNLKDRAHKGQLPPATEAMLWHYAYGKPMEQVTLTVNQHGDLEGLSLAELALRARQLEEKLEEAQLLADAIPASILNPNP